MVDFIQINRSLARKNKAMKNIIKVIFLLLSLNHFLNAQSKITDSLFQLAIKAEGIEKARLYNKLAENLFNINPDSSRVLALAALEISRKEKHKQGEYNSLLNTGIAYSYLGYNKEALEYHLKALEEFEDFIQEHELAEIHNELGIDYSYMSNFEKAVHHFIESLKIKEKIYTTDSPEHKKLISTSYNNIGLVFERIKNYDEAIVYYNKALSAAIPIGDSALLAQYYNNIGVAYDRKEMYEEALKYYLNAAAIMETRRKGNPLARIYSNLGIIYQNMDESQKALEYSQKALEIFKTTGDNLNYAITLSKTGFILLNLARTDEAYPYLSKSLEISKEIGSTAIIKDNYYYLSKYYAKKNNYLKAYEYRGNYIEIMDSIYNADMLALTSEMKTKYETEKKEKEIEVLTKDNEIQNLKLKRQQARFWFLSVGSLIALLTLILAFIVYRLRQKNKHTNLEKKNLEVEQRMLRSQMNPHFIFNSMSSVQGFITKNDKQAAMVFLSDFAELMRSILENSRQSMISLNEEINTLKLYIELEQLRLRNKFDFNIKVDPKLNPDEVFIPPMLIQPFAENAIKHGLIKKTEKGNLEITFKKDEKMLVCSVIDDGIGRKEAEANKPEGHRSLGMQVTRERLETINKQFKSNASFNIIDLKDNNGTAKGTRVDIILPSEEE